MSETPEAEHPAGSPPPPQTVPIPPVPAPSQPTPAPSRPAKPVYQRRSFQLAAVGVVGLLLGCLIGLGIGLVSGLVAGGRHGRDDIGRHHQWGPGDGYRQPDRKRLPGGPFAPPPLRRPQSANPNPINPSPVSPSPQAG
jgi:hypothetical protein